MRALLAGTDARLIPHTMISAEPVAYITEQEYLEGEMLSEERHEYFDGHVYAMAGATDSHEIVAMNIAGLLWAHLRGKPCRVFKGDLKVRLRFIEKPLYYYPDVMVACDPTDNHRLYRERPKLLIEVLSKDENKDWVEKSSAYRRIESLEEYVIADPNPDQPVVWILRREDGWEPPETARGMEAEFTLRSVGLTLRVSDLFV